MDSPSVIFAGLTRVILSCPFPSANRKMHPASALQTGRFLNGQSECTEVGMVSMSDDRKKTWERETHPRRKVSRQQGYDQGMRGKKTRNVVGGRI